MPKWLSVIVALSLALLMGCGGRSSFSLLRDGGSSAPELRLEDVAEPENRNPPEAIGVDISESQEAIRVTLLAKEDFKSAVLAYQLSRSSDGSTIVMRLQE